MPYIDLSAADIATILTGTVLPPDLVTRLQAAQTPPTAWDQQVVTIAQTMPWARDGEVEVALSSDGHPLISAGDDNGAYVLCWGWAAFTNTGLDQATPEHVAEGPSDEEAGSGPPG